MSNLGNLGPLGTADPNGVRLPAGFTSRIVAMSDLSEFVKSLPTMEVPIAETWAKPIWHQPWIFGLVILLFALEWGIRRWKGLA